MNFPRCDEIVGVIATKADIVAAYTSSPLNREELAVQYVNQFH